MIFYIFFRAKASLTPHFNANMIAAGASRPTRTQREVQWVSGWSVGLPSAGRREGSRASLGEPGNRDQDGLRRTMKGELRPSNIIPQGRATAASAALRGIHRDRRAEGAVGTAEQRAPQVSEGCRSNLIPFIPCDRDFMPKRTVLKPGTV